MKILDLKSADLTEMVFNNRNQQYGAYQLRRNYSKHMTTAILIACAIFLLSIGFPIVAKMLNLFKEEEKTAMIVTQVELVDPPPLDENKPEPPKVEPPPPVKETIQFVAPEIKKDEEVVEQEEDPIKIIDSLKLTDAQVANKSQEGDEDATEVIGKIESEVKEKVDVVVKEVVEAPKVYTIVEVNPEFPGGYPALVKYLKENIKYPKQAIDNNIEGKVYLTFKVGTTGDISDIQLKRGIGGGCDEEAMRVAKTMPKWNPGKQQGKAVIVQFNLPINFEFAK